jgi:cytochrome c-type biogenesis protein CcmH/NrfF
MLRFVLAAALGFSALAVSQMTVTADDKKDDKKATKLEGKLVCSKCKLSETEACGNALVVKDGDKTITYYLSDKGKAEKYHKCSGEADAVVTGKVVEKEKKKYIEDAKVEKK